MFGKGGGGGGVGKVWEKGRGLGRGGIWEGVGFGKGGIWDDEGECEKGRLLGEGFVAGNSLADVGVSVCVGGGEGGGRGRMWS